MAAQLGSRGRGLPGAVRSDEVFKGPAFRQGRQRSYRGRISRSPGAQASGLPTASASAPPFGPIRFRHSRRNYSLSVRGVQVAATTIRLAAHHFLFGVPVPLSCRSSRCPRPSGRSPHHTKPARTFADGLKWPGVLSTPPAPRPGQSIAAAFCGCNATAQNRSCMNRCGRILAGK